MIKKILLVCANGLSTGMLVEKMKEVATEQNMKVVIDAGAANSVTDYLPADVILLGPQMGHMEDDIRNRTGHKIPVAVINMMDYGMMDGGKILADALKLIEK